ncbi:Uncharacterised protein [Chryseobacterium nakagawai]|uniref:Uncharacterized protein n=1 Tax=Chryseobacterium nakagawai TaxID=1241982 RepID=A0AAD1DQU6_CHRNA|nr:hypothetical protein [Chryseobacterium nakagawai]AZA91143.1 hypothetical protein EG343_11130 [Chryseobacterium nakagawai]VEH22703.1 Uncharacterised protein [Chryseobacterium nakagawai]
MTKEELLKIYSAYIPYGLEFISSKDNERHLLTDVKTVSDYPLWASTEWNEETLKYEPEINLKPSGGIGNGFKIEEVKPILYDLSYLTKEIEHEGETFVPTERLMNYASNFGVNRGVFEHMLSSILEGNTCITELPYYLIIKLLEWHLNIFQLPEDQFINKATLTNK